MKTNDAKKRECCDAFQRSEEERFLSVPDHIGRSLLKKEKTNLGKQMAAVITILLNISRLNEEIEDYMEDEELSTLLPAGIKDLTEKLSKTMILMKMEAEHPEDLDKDYMREIRKAIHDRLAMLLAESEKLLDACSDTEDEE